MVTFLSLPAEIVGLIISEVAACDDSFEEWIHREGRKAKEARRALLAMSLSRKRFVPFAREHLWKRIRLYSSTGISCLNVLKSSREHQGYARGTRWLSMDGFDRRSAGMLVRHFEGLRSADFAHGDLQLSASLSQLRFLSLRNVRLPVASALPIFPHLRQLIAIDVAFTIADSLLLSPNQWPAQIADSLEELSVSIVQGSALQRLTLAFASVPRSTHLRRLSLVNFLPEQSLACLRYEPSLQYLSVVPSEYYRINSDLVNVLSRLGLVEFVWDDSKVPVDWLRQLGNVQKLTRFVHESKTLRRITIDVVQPTVYGGGRGAVSILAGYTQEWNEVKREIRLICAIKGIEIAGNEYMNGIEGVYRLK